MNGGQRAEQITTLVARCLARAGTAEMLIEK
jgi:hypothetical protein